MVTDFDIEEHPLPEGQQNAAPVRSIATEYFKTMGIPIRQGRVFDENDRMDSTPVVIVNERFANKFFPGQTCSASALSPGLALTKPAKRCAKSSGLSEM